MSTQVTTSGITFNDSTTQTTAKAGADVQIFNTSGTWTKPTGRSMCKIMMWGGGGGGGKSVGSNSTGGGGGGGYNEQFLPLSYLNSSVSVTVGLGGSATSSGGGAGGQGGQSSVPLNAAWIGRSTIDAYGGGGGGGNGSIYTTWTGMGGGSTSAGNNSATTYSDGVGQPFVGYHGRSGCTSGWFHGAGGWAQSGNAMFGGAGGGSGQPNNANSPGGQPVYVPGTLGGKSLYGGNGGTGGNYGQSGSAGNQPGGGGGSTPSNGATSGAGAAGRVIIISF